MNRLFLRLALALAGATIALNAAAHDPKEHAKEAAAAKAGPDCAKLKTMDMSKMDPNDPVMKALQAKCAKADAPHDHDAHAPAKDDKNAPASTDDHGGHR